MTETLCQCCKKRKLIKLALYENAVPLLICEICDGDDLLKAITTNNEDEPSP